MCGTIKLLQKSIIRLLMNCQNDLRHTSYYNAAEILGWTEKILRSSWMPSEPDAEQLAEDALPLSKFSETISQGQGSQHLRRAVVSATTQAASMQVLSPKALREASHYNEFLHRLFTFKRVAHALGIKGNIPLANGSTIPLECFNETFVLPMLASSFETFAHESNQPQILERANDLKAVFSEAIYHDNSDDAKIQKAVEMINAGTQKGPLLIGAGWNWHSTQVIIYNDFFCYHNRGADSTAKGSGWQLYKMGNKEKITVEWIKKLTKRLLVPQSEYLSQQTIVKDLQASSLMSHFMQSQKAGNCTYTSLKSAISCLLLLWEMNPHFESEMCEDMVLKIHESEHWKVIYKLFTAFDRQLVARDLLIDLEEAVQSAPDVSLIKMAELLYLKLLKTPLLGEKLGWPLWLKLVQGCQKLHTPHIKISEEWLKLAEEFSQAEAIPNLPSEGYETRLFKLGKLLAHQLNPEGHLRDILKKLAFKGHFDVAYNLITIVPQEDARNKVAKALADEMLSMGKLNQAEKCALLISNNHKNLLLENICQALIDKMQFQEAQRVSNALLPNAQKLVLVSMCFKQIACGQFMEAKQLALQKLNQYGSCDSYFNSICKALALQDRYKEVEEIDALISEESVYKYDYLKDVCTDLVKKGKTDQALNLASRIPNAHPLKKETLRAIYANLITMQQYEEIVANVKALPDEFAGKMDLFNYTIENLALFQCDKAIELEKLMPSHLREDANVAICKGLARIGQFDQALELTQELKRYKHAVLNSISEILAQKDEFDKAEQVTLQIPEEVEVKYRYLENVCLKLIKDGHLEKALSIAWAIPNSHQNKLVVLKAIVNHLSNNKQYKEIVEIAQVIPHELNGRAKFYHFTFFFLMIKNQCDEALTIARIIPSSDIKTAEIWSLAERLITAQRLEDVKELASLLPEDLHSKKADICMTLCKHQQFTLAREIAASLSPDFQAPLLKSIIAV